ncbi:hypothetical protein P1X15_07125 [Runella sp. MFBS21]|uniref:DUF6712 family protein n=1 Tax=Runella sp. MFBS21 TaxID=3034018 RepID=UPI0023FA2D3E|nr:DUF6712 family protein [Runella sp. MFBS21]MDF7817358.1 hypothetical protein [Runella sp. MFBS21]
MIIKNIEQLKAALGGIQQQMDWRTFEPFVRQAEKVYIIPAIGQELYDELEALNAFSTEQTHLLEWLRIAIAEYADLLGGMRLYMHTSNAGKQVPQMPNMGPPSKWMTVTSIKQGIAKADLALENALQYLEKNKEAFSTWAESESYTLDHSLFLSSATELTKYFPAAKQSRRLYLSLRHYIETAQEFFLEPLIGTPQLTAWIARMADDDVTPSPQEEKAWKLARYALAHQAFAESIPYLNINEDWRLVSETDGIVNEDELDAARRQEMLANCQAKAEEFKNRLLTYLNSVASATVFPEYFSSMYQPPKKPRATSIENDPSKPYFAF